MLKKATDEIIISKTHSGYKFPNDSDTLSTGNKIHVLFYSIYVRSLSHA